MTLIRVVNRTRGTMLGSRVRLADSLASRSRGFLFRPAPGPGEGILLSPCQAVHMFGVRFPLDVVFINGTGVVMAIYPDLAPWRWSRLHRAALHALELPPGTIAATGTAVGDALSWTAADGETEVIELPVRGTEPQAAGSVEPVTPAANGAGAPDEELAAVSEEGPETEDEPSASEGASEAEPVEVASAGYRRARRRA